MDHDSREYVAARLGARILDLRDATWARIAHSLAKSGPQSTYPYLGAAILMQRVTNSYPNSKPLVNLAECGFSAVDTNTNPHTLDDAWRYEMERRVSLWKRLRYAWTRTRTRYLSR